MNINQTIAGELNIALWQVDAVVKLIDEGNTIPFIARYRKDAHGTLNDEQIRGIDERLTYLRSLDERRNTVLSTIEEQGKLTEVLKKQIEAASTLVALEDLYRPYRPKRRTRAMIAKEKGLQGLADLILAQEMTENVQTAAQRWVDPEKGVESAADAIAGAKDIIAESISDRADLRGEIRERTMEEGILTSEVKKDMDDPQSVYAQYFHYEEPVRRVPGHRVLALNRGEKEKVLTVCVTAPEEKILGYLQRKILVSDNPATSPLLREVCDDAYHRLIGPAIEREVRSSLTEKAEDGAIDVFGKNLRQLLMQPPVAGQTVLGWDPAFRTGCKLAVVDETGKVLDTRVIYPTAPTTPAKIEAAKSTVKELIEKYHITLISCGNGTASRESEQIIAQLISEIQANVHYVIVNEAGASVYSASRLATEEFPNFDVGQRSAASIARRIQDPLAELVKIDPKSIGVGQYQHDCDQKKLGEKLEGVVEACVNEVGVDLNTASYPLLEYVSGLTKKTARNIVSWREENGKFTDRRQLLKVAGLGPKAYEQCAGFLRIRGGKNVLDMTGVHPESYEAAEKLLAAIGYSQKDVLAGRVSGVQKRMKEKGGLAGLASAFGVGEETLKDIAGELEKPGRDPRADMPKPILRSDVLKMEDLRSGMILKGTVRNIVDFGAFVDIGVHQDGLVHVSEMSETKFVRHPLEVVSVGDIVDVKVLDVDLKRQRIALTMKLGEKAEGGGRPGGKAEGTGKGQAGEEGGRTGSRRAGGKAGAADKSGGKAEGTGKGQAGEEGSRTGSRRAGGSAGRGDGKRRSMNGRAEAGGLDLSELLKKWQ